MRLRSFRAARALTQFYGTAAAAAALIDRMARRRTRYASPPTRRTRGIFTMFGLTKHFSELVGKMRNCSKSLFYRGASENSRARESTESASVVEVPRTSNPKSRGKFPMVEFPHDDTVQLSFVHFQNWVENEISAWSENETPQN